MDFKRENFSLNTNIQFLLIYLCILYIYTHILHLQLGLNYT